MAADSLLLIRLCSRLSLFFVMGLNWNLPRLEIEEIHCICCVCQIQVF